jgi:hypothetical protein
MYSKEIDKEARERWDSATVVSPRETSLALAYDLLSWPVALTSPAELADDPGVVPSEPGVYGWWFDQAPSIIPLAGAVQQGRWRWLYVGISNARPAGQPDLRATLSEQVGGSVGSSLLRLTLAVLLQSELRLSFARGAFGRLLLVRDGEARLSRWMNEHARVTWLVHTEAKAVRDYALSLRARLPLNIEGSEHPFAKRLMAARAAAIPGFT